MMRAFVRAERAAVVLSGVRVEPKIRQERQSLLLDVRRVERGRVVRLLERRVLLERDADRVVERDGLRRRRGLRDDRRQSWPARVCAAEALRAARSERLSLIYTCNECD